MPLRPGKYLAQTAALLVLYPALGWMVVWAPRKPWSKALSPIDGMGLLALVLLFGVGMLGGWAAPRQTPFLAMMAVGAWPVLALIQMQREPTSHNLWPIEFLFYGLLSLVPFAGAFLGIALRAGRFGKRPRLRGRGASSP